MASLFPKEQPPIYIALNKPRGVLSDTDPSDPRQTVFDLVPVNGHLFSVGRLDLDSEGLILLTNDGDLANRLTHPRYGHEKEYRVLVATRPDAEQLATWRRGVVLEDGYKTAPARVEIESQAGKGTWMRVILHEGRKRQIREIGRLIGLPVVKIIRVRIGMLLLGNLKIGEWRYLNSNEVRLLQAGPTPQEEHRIPRRQNYRPGRDQRSGNQARREYRPAGQTSEGRPESADRPARFQRSGDNRSSSRPEGRRPSSGGRWPSRTLPKVR